MIQGNRSDLELLILSKSQTPWTPDGSGLTCRRQRGGSQVCCCRLTTSPTSRVRVSVFYKGNVGGIGSGVGGVITQVTWCSWIRLTCQEKKKNPFVETSSLQVKRTFVLRWIWLQLQTSPSETWEEALYHCRDRKLQSFKIKHVKRFVKKKSPNNPKSCTCSCVELMMMSSFILFYYFFLLLLFNSSITAYTTNITDWQNKYLDNRKNSSNKNKIN